MVVIGHSQSLQLTGLGKSLPLIFQQQPRLNCRKRESTQRAHLEYPAWVKRKAVPLNLVRHHYIRPCYQDTESKQLYLIHRN